MITPFVIFFFGDIAVIKLFGGFKPSKKHFMKISGRVAF